MNRVGQLKRGMKVGESVHTEFELRPLTTGDLFAAEVVSGAEKTITFSAALLCQQLVRIGDYKGPFTLPVLAKLKPSDFEILRIAQVELDAEGEAEQPG